MAHNDCHRQGTMTSEARKIHSSSRASLFTNFEDVRLSDEEHVFLTAAAQGDVPIIRQSLEVAVQRAQQLGLPQGRRGSQRWDGDDLIRSAVQGQGKDSDRLLQDTLSDGSGAESADALRLRSAVSRRTSTILGPTSSVSRLNIDCVDYMGRSALHLAVDSESMEAVELILDARISFDCIEEALLHAISKGAAKLVRVIIEHPHYIADAARGGRGNRANAASAIGRKDADEGEKPETEAGASYRARAHRRGGIGGETSATPLLGVQSSAIPAAANVAAVTVASRDPFFRTDEKSQFSPDITPLILAAHNNNHEIVQMFLSRGHVIDRPHPISCRCGDCVTKQNYDSLKRSRSRLNAYRALASPAYMALSSPDPIMTTFELRQEMKKLAQVEKEFKNEYLGLVEQCMVFACELMDLCRGTQEVEAVLGESGDRNGSRDPLARLKMALEYEEKKFVAHPNCQQHLTSIWYGPEMGFLQSLPAWKQLLLGVVFLPLVPFFCLIYIVTPGNKIGRALRCPASKFLTHSLSHACFLILLAAATFRLDENDASSSANQSDSGATAALAAIECEGCDEHDRIEAKLKSTFRPANILMTNVQICLMFWILGLLWTECKQMYHCGIRVYLLDPYNWIDFIVLSLYLASYVLRFLVDHWIKQADIYYNGTAKAHEALITGNHSLYDRIRREIFEDFDHKQLSYFMKALRFEWEPDDPEIVSDVLFAIANVLSIARTTYLMPAFEVLGPLQISLGRMLGDITRFLVLFTLVLLAFMVGLHNLYWYYGSQTYVVKKDGTDKLVHTSEAFQGLRRTLYSLFWSMFGLVNVESVEIKYPTKETNDNPFANSFPGGSHATSVVEGVGLFLFALYHVAIIIVLTNMLIAMMSHSFEAIQGDCDVEWKFARTKLWMNYIDEGSTLPVPFNMLPTPKSFSFVGRTIRDMFLRQRISGEAAAIGGFGVGASGGLRETTHSSSGSSLLDSSYSTGKRQTFIKKRRDAVCLAMDIDSPQTSYSDILQRLVRRYLFKLERMKEEGKDAGGAGVDGNCVASTSLTGESYCSLNGSNKPEVEQDAAQQGPPAYADSTTAEGLHLETLRRQTSRGRRPTIPTLQVPPTVSTRTGGPGGGIPAAGSATTSSGGATSGGGGANVQLISLPQLDAVQRSLKVLDTRLQSLHQVAADEERLRNDIEHVLAVITENRKALSSVSAVLGSLHDEVRSLDSSLQPSLQLLRRANSRHAATTPSAAAAGATAAASSGTAPVSSGGGNNTSTTSSSSTATNRARKKSLNDTLLLQQQRSVQAATEAAATALGSLGYDNTVGQLISSIGQMSVNSVVGHKNS